MQCFSSPAFPPPSILKPQGYRARGTLFSKPRNNAGIALGNDPPCWACVRGWQRQKQVKEKENVLGKCLAETSAQEREMTHFRYGKQKSISILSWWGKQCCNSWAHLWPERCRDIRTPLLVNAFIHICTHVVPFRRWQSAPMAAVRSMGLCPKH